eukprot:jgi/Undpi1/7677/HiC_scaffold_23.g10150.m1
MVTLTFKQLSALAEEGDESSLVERSAHWRPNTAGASGVKRKRAQSRGTGTVAQRQQQSQALLPPPPPPPPPQQQQTPPAAAAGAQGTGEGGAGGSRPNAVRLSRNHVPAGGGRGKGEWQQ